MLAMQPARRTIMEEEKSGSVARWEPFADLFQHPFRELGGRRLARLFDEGRGELGAQLMPAVDIGEDDDQYIVTAEIPGACREDITVESDDNLLTIRGEKRCEREEKREQARWVERSYGSFSRSFTLPPNADTGRVAASFNEGVLRIEIPKAEQSKPKVISIQP
jgi:HSP20 family protein